MIMTLPTPRTPDPHNAPPLRWGILAPGVIAADFARTLLANTRQRITAVGSRSAERAAAFAAQFEIPRSHGSYEALVADPDVEAIYVASPHSHHLEQALLAIQAGKHVLVEKAFTRDAAEARELVAAARAADVTVMEAMKTRFLPHTDVIRQLLTDGALGELRSVRADQGSAAEETPGSRLFEPALAGGAMLDIGVYTVAFATMALGFPGGMAVTGRRAGTGVDLEVTVTADAFPHHPSATAHLHTTLAEATPCRAEITGTRASVTVPGPFQNSQQIEVRWRDDRVELSDPPQFLGRAGMCHEIAHFAQLVADGQRESPLLPLAESVAIMELMDTALARLP